MPKLAMDYSRTLIYKFVCIDLNITECYVGHTTNWTKRRNKHKYNCVSKNAKYSNFKVYKFIRDNGGWENWSMILIEEYPCENKLQAEQRERYWIETLKANLNCVIPSRTKKEWCEKYKDEIKDYQQKYRKDHKEELQTYKKEWYEEHKNEKQDNQKKYYEEHKEEIQDYMIKYYQINTDKIKAYKKEYYQKHKDELAIKRKNNRDSLI